MSSVAPPRGTTAACFLTLAFVVGCPVQEPVVSDVQATVSENIATVVTVTWTTDLEVTGYVEFGPGESYEHASPLSAAADSAYEALLLGLPADTDNSYRIVSVDADGEEFRSDPYLVHTDPLPAELPALTVEGSGNDRYSVIQVMGTLGGPLILSPEGEIVWYWADDRDLQFFRARLSIDGASLIYNASQVSGGPVENSEIVRVALDGSSTASIPVPLLAHDFVELPDGTIAAIVVEYRDYEGEPLQGDQIVEIAPDGTRSVVWSAWDCFDPAVDGDPTDLLGWTWANALDYDAAQDAYYLGMHSFSSIIRIDRATGACDWGLGGVAGTMSFAAGTSQFRRQHQFERLGDTILVFDNEGALSESRVMEYDISGAEAVEIWSYTADPSLETLFLGDVHRLDDGDTMVAWGLGGQIDRVSPSGEVRWQANTDLGFAVGYNTVEESLYR